MGLYIINGRNNNYPCVRELKDFDEFYIKKPYADVLFVQSAIKNYGYPAISGLTDIKRISVRVWDFSDICMYCFGDSINSGYPCIMKLSGTEAKVMSELYFNGCKVNKMNYKNFGIKRTYFNEKEVFSVKYEKI